VGPRTGLDRCGKSRPDRDSNPDRDVTVRLTFGIADVTLRLYINPISTVNEIHYGFNTQHLSAR